MRFENYTYNEFDGEMNSYEEQLLLNYDDYYLEGSFSKELTNRQHLHLELGELKDELEEDFDSEYEEEDLDEKLKGEYDKNEEKPGSFLMIS